MKVNRITPSPAFKAYRIKAEDNKHLPFLYNNVSDAIQKEGVTTTFYRDNIRLDRLTDSLKKKLDDLKIKYFKEEK